jgi:hypothetical protein
MVRITHDFHQQNAGDEHVDPAVATTATPVTAVPPVTDSPTPGPSPAPTFADLGATFNDATRALVGGLWQNVVEEGGQGHGSIGRYTGDLTTVQTGLLAEVNAGQFTGATLAHAQTILSDITTALSAATASVNGGGTFGSVANAEQALRASHLDVLNIVNSDPTLATLATQNGANGFMAAPSTLPDGTTAATAPHANFAEIGAIFNDAANHILGGVNAGNAGLISSDVNAVITDMQTLMHSSPELFGGLTGIHADTIVRQLELEKTYIAEAGINPDAGRASNDNILDIIDIVHGDTNLANMATQGGVTGFSPFPDAANPTPKYLDNAPQTAFWADFIAQSNTLGQQAVNTVGSHDPHAVASLIDTLQTFEHNVTHFDAAQGGIFEARFDNELLGNTSTLGAEVSAMIKGLQTGNAALVAAAADQMHGNAADVGGNNLPNTGGTYNADGLTVADVLSTAVPATAAVAAASPAAATVTAAPAPQTVASAAPPAASAPVATADAGASTAAGQAAVDLHNSHAHDMAQQLHHMWG